MIKLACPFCNHIFDVVSPVPSKVPCPNCHEPVPETALAQAGAHASEVIDPRPHPGNRWMPWVVGGVVLAAIAALVADSIWGTKLLPVVPTAPSDAGAITKPPLMLTSLRYLPANTQVAFALQPAVLEEYTHRKGKSVEIWLAQAGLPGKLFTEFRKLDLAPEQIDQLLIALPEATLSPVAVLVLKQALADEGEFRKKLNARAIVDKPGHFAVDLFGWPMEMKKANDTTYHFASESKLLDVPPAAGNDHLPQGLLDSLGKLSPASFAWIATDTARPDWSKNPMLNAASKFLDQPEMPKRFEKLQAFALGMATEPDLVLALAVRSDDAKTLADSQREKLASAKADVAVEGNWATAKMPAEPPQEAIQALRNAFSQ